MKWIRNVPVRGRPRYVRVIVDSDERPPEHLRVRFVNPDTLRTEIYEQTSNLGWIEATVALDRTVKGELLPYRD